MSSKGVQVLRSARVGIGGGRVEEVEDVADSDMAVGDGGVVSGGCSWRCCMCERGYPRSSVLSRITSQKITHSNLRRGPPSRSLFLKKAAVGTDPRSQAIQAIQAITRSLPGCPCRKLEFNGGIEPVYYNSVWPLRIYFSQKIQLVADARIPAWICYILHRNHSPQTFVKW